MRGGRELGVVEWFERGEHERVERVVAGLRELDIVRLRTAVSWADWHAAGGRGWYDWLLPRLARDFELLPCVHYTPPSLGVVPKSSAPPRRPRDYADFLDVFIDRFGHLFEHVELWNEPNNLNDWDWRLDPHWETFCSMVGDAAYWARRRGKRTVLGGMSPTDPHWLGLVASRGVLAYVDVVGIHAFPGSWTTVWNGWEEEFASVRDVLAATGARSEVWVTEAGFSTWRRDEFGQLQAFLEVLAAPADRVYWYAAEDLSVARPACDGDHVDPRHYHFGLRTEDGHPKLLARALRDGGPPTARLLSGLERKPPPRSRRRYSLVTGGAGFVGTNLADRLLRDGKQVLVFDNLIRPGVEQNVAWLEDRHPTRCRVQVGDLRDPLALREAVSGAEEVFHLGAQVAVTTSVERPVEDWSVNLEGTLRLLEEMRRLREPPPLLFTSTNKVYGTLRDVPLTSGRGRWEPEDPRLRASGIDERRPLDFCTPYGCSKGAADQYVLDYAKTFGLQTVVFRMSCIYGFHQHGNEDQGWVAHFLLRSLENRPIAIYGDGRQVRDVLFVSDLVDAMVLARERIATLGGRAFNIGGGPENTISLLELVALLDELNGGAPPIVFGDERPGDQRWYVTDTSRFRDATGWAPAVSAREGVEALYSWFGRRDLPDELLATV
jgi:CDP-paratose 2-epimerase